MRLSFDDGVALFAVRTCTRWAGWPTASANGGTARAPTTTSTSGSRPPTSAPPVVCSARLRGSSRAIPAGLHAVARAGARQARGARRPAADRSARRQRPAPGPAVQLLHGSAARPEARSAGNPPEVFHRRRDCVLRRHLRDERRDGAARVDGGRARFAAGRRRRDLRAARAQERSRTTRPTPIAISRFIGWRTAWACART